MDGRGSSPSRAAGPLLALWLVAAAGCEDRTHREIAAELHLLLDPNAAMLSGTASRLTTFGRQAIPQIEVALHTAPDRGRQDLVAALIVIGDPEAVPILQHLAVYDDSAAVRETCRQALAGWKAEGGKRGRSATQALERIAALDAQGIGPSPQAGPPPK